MENAYWTPFGSYMNISYVSAEVQTFHHQSERFQNSHSRQVQIQIVDQNSISDIAGSPAMSPQTQKSQARNELMLQRSVVT